LLFVIDSNVYIFGLGLVKVPACEKFIFALLKEFPRHSLRISRSITEEVRRHLSREDFQRFIKIINTLTLIDEDSLIPFELGAKYESAGLKPGDASIPAYTEWVGADVLVTENRHFLTRSSDLPFKVLTTEECLKSI